MRKVAKQKEGVVFSQASGVRKIPQLKANVLHCGSLHVHKNAHGDWSATILISKPPAATSDAWTHRWYFVSVKNKGYATAAVVQMAAVWLALCCSLWR